MNQVFIPESPERQESSSQRLSESDPTASSNTADPASAAPGGGTFGPTLRAIRRKRKLRQSQLADSMEQSTSYMSLLENGQRPPTQAVLEGVERALNALGMPLTSAEQAALAAAADVRDPHAQLLKYARAILSTGNLDEFQRALLRQGVEHVINGYLDLSKAYQNLKASRFQVARDQFSKLAGPEGAALPALARAAAGVSLADVTLKLGDPDGASEAITRALGLIYEALPTSPLSLQAEALAIQGMINLRLGEYTMSRTQFQAALDLYSRADASVREDASGAENADVVAIGLTKSYNRLALLSLLMGDPRPAISYCDSALDKLKRVSKDPEDLTDPRRLRLFALRAWACAEQGKFREARALREQCLETYQRQDDSYGVAKTHLYMADDARLEIQQTVEPRLEMPFALAGDRVAKYGARLRKREIHDLVEYAEEHYGQAITAFEQLKDAVLLGRAHRGLGETLRYKALRDPDAASAHRVESRQELQIARNHDEWAKQGRLLPGALISLARLDWDQGHLASARDLLAEATQQLRASASPEDKAACEQIDWCERALQVIQAEIGAQTSQPQSTRTQAVSGISPAWQDLTLRLARAVTNGIERNHAQPVALESLTVGWTQRLYELDERWGPRLVAQDDLSTCNERYPLQGLEREVADGAAEYHIARFLACESRIREIHDHSSVDAYIDICVRQVVAERVNAKDALSIHARLRAAEVLRRLRELPKGYRLLVVDEPLPIHIFVKGDKALIELTPAASQIDPRLASHIVGRGNEICYAFDDPETVGIIKGVFTDMRLIAEQRNSPESTIAWLSALLGDAAPGDPTRHKPRF